MIHPNENEKAPLFVKIEKYNEIITKIEEIKGFTDSLHRYFALMEEVISIKTQILNAMRALIQKVEKDIVELNAIFLPPERPPEPSKKILKVDETLQTIEQQVKDLKSALEKVE